VVLQLTSAGADKWREAIVAGLVQATGCAAVYERSDSEVRGLEGLESRTGCAHGELPAGGLTIVENGMRMEVDVEGGHKTGFYLDQRDNRLLTGQLAGGRAVLNCFCYTGGFSLQALAGGAARCCRSTVRPGAGVGAAQPGAQPAARRQRAPSGGGRRLQEPCAR
jgi:23S rRNA (cytosine1962-C5)-methyltransferase